MTVLMQALQMDTHQVLMLMMMVMLAMAMAMAMMPPP